MSDVMHSSAAKENTPRPGSLTAYIPRPQEIAVGGSQASSKWGRDEEWFCETRLHMKEPVRSGPRLRVSLPLAWGKPKTFTQDLVRQTALAAGHSRPGVQKVWGVAVSLILIEYS